jgi:hypothetical protein
MTACGKLPANRDQLRLGTAKNQAVYYEDNSHGSGPPPVPHLECQERPKLVGDFAIPLAERLYYPLNSLAINNGTIANSRRVKILVDKVREVTP